MKRELELEQAEKRRQVVAALGEEVMAKIFKNMPKEEAPTHPKLVPKGPKQKEKVIDDRPRTPFRFAFESVEIRSERRQPCARGGETAQTS